MQKVLTVKRKQNNKTKPHKQIKNPQNKQTKKTTLTQTPEKQDLMVLQEQVLHLIMQVAIKSQQWVVSGLTLT